MPRRYWLMKCEPEAYTIEDLERDRATPWEGVRNYQARNLLRDDMQVGDGVLFYASNADPSGVTGLARIERAGFPDPTAWKKGHEYFDAASTPANPVWYSVEIGFVERFAATIPLATLKATPGLGEDDGGSERQPTVGPAGDAGRVRDRRPPRPSAGTRRPPSH